jgi:hypothetical protein
LFGEASGRSRPVAPPAVGPGPDHVGSVDQQHRNSIAPPIVSDVTPWIIRW